nr:Protein of unknown function DUF148 domain containing protein [Haemonchus contortus]
MEVSWKAQQEYDRILHNPKLTIAQQKEQIMVWAKKYKVTNEVKSFFTKFGRRMEKMDQNLAELVDELPKAAHNLTEIMKNQNQTMLQMMDATEGLRREHHSAFHVLMFAMTQEFFHLVVPSLGITLGEILGNLIGRILGRSLGKEDGIADLLADGHILRQKFPGTEEDGEVTGNERWQAMFHVFGSFLVVDFASG